MREKGYIFILLIAGLAFSSCSKKKWEKTADISIVYGVTTSTVEFVNNEFVMDTLSVTFSKMELAGDRLQADYITVGNTGSVRANFITGNSTGSSVIALPQGTFDLLDMPLTIGGSGAASLHISGDYYLPNGDINKVVIDLVIDRNELISVLDNDNSSRVLIEEGNARNVKLTMNPIIFFSEVNQGLWNAASITNANGAQTIVVNELSNQSIYYALLAGFSTSLTAKFE